MPPKRFYGATLHGALKAVKEQFGENAVIISTRQLAADEWRPKEAGVSAIEVIASDDPIPATAPGRIGEAPRSSDPEMGEPDIVVPPPARRHEPDLGEEIHRIHSYLKQLASNEPSGFGAICPCSVRVLRRLKSQGVDPAFASAMLDSIVREAPSEELADPASFEAAARRELIDQILTYDALENALDLELAVGFGGPSGVGKSTCAAKIASVLALDLGIPVRIATVCPDGIAAADVLLTAGKLLGIPVDRIEKVEDIPDFLRVSRGKEKVVLDLNLPDRWSHGLSKATVSILANCTNLETHIVLSSGSKREDLVAAAHWSQAIPAEALIFTKMDETRTLGCVFEAMRRSRLPASFFSLGKRIPEDLVPASASDLAGWLLDGWRDCA